MLDIKEILKKLSLCNKIDFTGKESDLELLAKKYDENQNSLFEEDEILKMTDDLLLSTKQDGNQDELSDEEANRYFKSVSPKESSFKRFIKRIGKAILPENSRIIRFFRERQVKKNTQELEKELSVLIETGEQNKKDLIEKKVKDTLNDAVRMELEDEKLLTLKTTDLERLIDLLYIKERKRNQLKVSDLKELSKLNNEELEWVKNNLLYIEEREEQFNGYYMVKLAKNENKDLIKKYLKRNSFSESGLINIANNYSEELAKYIDTHPENIYTDYSTGEYVKFDDLNDGMQYFTFDKTGLIETGEFENSAVGFKCIFNNTKSNIKIEVTDDRFGKENEYVKVSEIITYYDCNGNTIKTVNIKRNMENGFLNVSEIDRYGKKKPIQWESTDPHTGAKITEKHLTSPDGTKTEFYAEESDNLKITDYKIIDSNGKVLINVNQTFEQISENKFISSINTTGEDKDTQIYEIEYSYKKVKIFDKTNNKITELNLRNYFEDLEATENILPIIKQLPGHVLLEFAEKPFKLKYDFKNIENGNFNNATNVLTMGNYDHMTNKEKNMLAIFTHEIGHYLDLYNVPGGRYSQNPEIIQIYNEELEAFNKVTTTIQHEHIGYFIDGDGLGVKVGHEEKTAEAHALLYSADAPLVNLRQFYFAQYFPRTIAAIMKLLLEEEGIIININNA